MQSCYLTALVHMSLSYGISLEIRETVSLLLVCVTENITCMFSFQDSSVLEGLLLVSGPFVFL